MQILEHSLTVMPLISRALEHPDSTIQQLPLPGGHLISVNPELPGNLSCSPLLTSSFQSHFRLKCWTMIPALPRHKHSLSRAYRLHLRECPTIGVQRLFNPWHSRTLFADSSP